MSLLVGPSLESPAEASVPLHLLYFLPSNLLGCFVDNVCSCWCRPGTWCEPQVSLSLGDLLSKQQDVGFLDLHLCMPLCLKECRETIWDDSAECIILRSILV